MHPKHIQKFNECSVHDIESIIPAIIKLPVFESSFGAISYLSIMSVISNVRDTGNSENQYILSVLKSSLSLICLDKDLSDVHVHCSVYVTVHVHGCVYVTVHVHGCVYVTVHVHCSLLCHMTHGSLE